MKTWALAITSCTISWPPPSHQQFQISWSLPMKQNGPQFQLADPWEQGQERPWGCEVLLLGLEKAVFFRKVGSCSWRSHTSIFGGAGPMSCRWKSQRKHPEPYYEGRIRFTLWNVLSLSCTKSCSKDHAMTVGNPWYIWFKLFWGNFSLSSGSFLPSSYVCLFMCSIERCYPLPSSTEKMDKEKNRHSQWLPLVVASKPYSWPRLQMPWKKHVGLQFLPAPHEATASDSASSPPWTSHRDSPLGLTLCRPMSCLECFLPSVFPLDSKGSPNRVFCPRPRVQYSRTCPWVLEPATWPQILLKSVLRNTLTHTSSSLQRVWPN